MHFRSHIEPSVRARKLVASRASVPKQKHSAGVQKLISDRKIVSSDPYLGSSTEVVAVTLMTVGWVLVNIGVGEGGNGFF